MNRRRGAARIAATHSARSVARQRPRARRPGAAAAGWAAVDSLRGQVTARVDRWAQLSSERAARPARPLIGLDVAKPPRRLRTRAWVPIAGAVVLGALFLVVVRVDVIRLRFDVAQQFEEELRLQQLKRDLTVAMRQLRDPALLDERARERGFQPAERLIDLGPESPARGSGGTGPYAFELAARDHGAGARP